MPLVEKYVNATVIPLYTASRDVESGRLTLHSVGGSGEQIVLRDRYSRGGGSLSPQDIRQIIDAFEQLDWVQYAKSMMVSSQPAPGEVGGPGAAENLAPPVPKLKLSPTAAAAPEPTFTNAKPPGRYGKSGEPERYDQRHAHLSSAIEIEPAGSAVRLDFMGARRELYAAEQTRREELSNRARRLAIGKGISFERAMLELGETAGVALG